MKSVPTNIIRLVAALIFFVWMTFVLAAYYVVQKPIFFEGLSGIADTIWTLAVFVLISSNALGIGHTFLSKFGREQNTASERIIFGIGLGLGMMGVLGFFFGALGITSSLILIGFQIGLGMFLIWRKIWRSIALDLFKIKSSWMVYRSEIHPFTKIAFGFTFLIAFLLALAPPIDAFDSLSYHLPAPLLILEDGGIYPYDVYAFWHPGLAEGNFFWGLAAGSDRVAQLLHELWGILGVLLVGYWSKTVWNATVAQKSVLVILSLPSLYRLASWAYTDLALAFYTIAALYAIVRWLQPKYHGNYFWLLLSGIMTGMAMGIKYTSFVLPISVMLIMLLNARKDWFGFLKWSMVFGITTVLVASPWYLRNWIVMGNPFYPFVFGGRYWDDFRSIMYADMGSGIGWNFTELLLLPLNATLGHQDATYYGGRLGPLFLVLFPLTLYTIVRGLRETHQQGKWIFSISLFVFINFLVWGIGVINVAHLWQTRFLYPAMILFSMLTALGWEAARNLNTSALRLSFILNILVGSVVILGIVDAGVVFIQRNPIAFAMGLETRQNYMARVQPVYANAIELLDETPADAKIYFLFEPRSYYFNRKIQPDMILDNLAHDLYLFASPLQVYEHWKDQGYTHVLLFRRGAEFLKDDDSPYFKPEHQEALESIILDYLILVGMTEDGAYELYVIPAK